MKKVIIFFLLLIVAQLTISAQSAKPPHNWWLLDSSAGYPYGMAVEKAYQTVLKNKKPLQKVIVAVIDDGINYNHPAMQGIVWTNKKEIPGNGIDDDHNGYIDDEHGWNFNGNRHMETEEVIREYVRLKNIFDSVKDTNQAKLLPEYSYWKLIEKQKAQWIKNQEYKLYENYGSFRDSYKYEQLYWSKKLQTDSVYIWQIKDKQPDADADSMTIAAHKTLLEYLPYLPADTLKTIIHASNDFEEESKVTEAMDKLPLQNAQVVIEHEDPSWFRRNALQDDGYQNASPYYGNNNTLPFGSSHHGTFCAGIIAAINNSNKYPNAVLIMPIRISPDIARADEWDKDVANAIRYAVDNGAKVISMSFGKYLSSQKQWVRDAIIYARKRNVLLIHAAGNDGNDVDIKNHYPSAYDSNNTRFENFINVGASTYTSKIVGSFSNYGKDNVDVFAPGVDIYSAAADNGYEYNFGTSFSTPMVSGLAALIWSYYRTLTYKQIKYCIEKSATPIETLVTKGRTNEKVPFSSLSKSGGIVNAYNAVKLADEMVKKNSH